MNAELLAKYREVRPGRAACYALSYARYLTKKRCISRAPYEGESEKIAVPGLGLLVFRTHADNDHDAHDDDSVRYEWKQVYSDDPRYKRACTRGGHLGGGWYSLAYWDRNRVYCVRFLPDSGGQLEGRRGYHHKQGMSRHDAHCAALQSIRDECDRLSKIAHGDVYYVGLACELRTWDDEKIICEEECWGFEGDDEVYLADTLHDWAEGLVAYEWKKRYGDVGPSLMEDTARYRKALRAYEAAMVASDGDNDLSDRVFVSTYQEKQRAKAARR